MLVRKLFKILSQFAGEIFWIKILQTQNKNLEYFFKICLKEYLEELKIPQVFIKEFIVKILKNGMDNILEQFLLKFRREFLVKFLKHHHKKSAKP